MYTYIHLIQLYCSIFKNVSHIHMGSICNSYSTVFWWHIRIIHSSITVSVCSKLGYCYIHEIDNSCSNPEFEKQGSTKNFFTIRELNSFHHILYFFGFHPKEIVNLKCWWHIMFLRLRLCVLNYLSILLSWEKLTEQSVIYSAPWFLKIKVLRN